MKQDSISPSDCYLKLDDTVQGLRSGVVEVTMTMCRMMTTMTQQLRVITSEQVTTSGILLLMHYLI